MEKRGRRVKEMADNRQLAKKILDAVGGRENIVNATHCMTRLRLNLKDTTVPSDEEIRKIPGVLGVNRNGDQYQVIIGPSVSKVYDEFCKIGDFAKEVPVEENLDGKKEKMTLSAAAVLTAVFGFSKSERQEMENNQETA